MSRFPPLSRYAIVFMDQGSFSGDVDGRSLNGVAGYLSESTDLVNSGLPSSLNSNTAHGQSASDFAPPHLSFPSTSSGAFQQRPASFTSLQYPQPQSLPPNSTTSPSHQSWNPTQKPYIYPQSPPRLSPPPGTTLSTYPRSYGDSHVFQPSHSVEGISNPPVSS